MSLATISTRSRATQQIAQGTKARCYLLAIHETQLLQEPLVISELSVVKGQGITRVE